MQLLDTITAQVLSTRVGQSVETPAQMGPLVCVGRSYPAGTTYDMVEDGSAEVLSAKFSADGRTWTGEWHSGPEADAVYVERWGADGSGFHGWVDSVSRRIVQAG